jgi:hypothetical protein
VIVQPTSIHACTMKVVDLVAASTVRGPIARQATSSARGEVDMSHKILVGDACWEADASADRQILAARESSSLPTDSSRALLRRS